MKQVQRGTAVSHITFSFLVLNILLNKSGSPMTQGRIAAYQLSVCEFHPGHTSRYTNRSKLRLGVNECVKV